MCISKHITAGKAKAAGNSLLSPHQFGVTLKKEPHRGFTQVCIQERLHLWEPDPPAEGRKSGVGADGNYMRLDPTVWICLSLQQKTGSAPPGKVLPSRGCSALLSRGNAILHRLLPSHLFQIYLFSSLASCCRLMLYTFCFSSWIRLLYFFTFKFEYIGKMKKCLLCSSVPPDLMSSTEEIISIS